MENKVDGENGWKTEWDERMGRKGWVREWVRKRVGGEMDGKQGG